jgi:uncharacterized Zn-binding protein involved in type VI secretion
MGQPSARIGDQHTCPQTTAMVPHVGGPIITGAPTVLACGMPAARVTDTATCVGPVDSIATGSGSVMICGLPAARIGDKTMHGGVIITGAPTVFIGG